MDRLTVVPTMPPFRHSNVVHLASCTDFTYCETVHRFIVDGRRIKYITAGQGVLSMANISAEPLSSILPQLPRFPPGNWNAATVARHPHNGGVFFESCLRTALPGVRSLWHPIRIDQLQLVELENLGNDVYVVGHPWLQHDKVVAVYNHFPSGLHSIDNETAIYKAIHKLGISYDFVGHIMERDRAIGYLIEYIQGHRLPGPEDVDSCLEILTRLHKLGYKHGRISKEIFHIRLNKMWLTDLSVATKCTDLEEHKLERDIVAFVVAGITPSFGWDECPPGEMEEGSGGDEERGISTPASSIASTDGSTKPSSTEAIEEERVDSISTSSTGSTDGSNEPAATNTTSEDQAITCPIKDGLESVVAKAVEERSLLEVRADAALSPPPSEDSEDDVETPPTDEDSIIIFPDDQRRFDHKAAQRVIDQYDGLGLSTELETSYTGALLAAGVGEEVAEAIVKTRPIPTTDREQELTSEASIVKDQSKEDISTSKASASAMAHNVSESAPSGMNPNRQGGETLQGSTTNNRGPRKFLSCNRNAITTRDVAESSSNGVGLAVRSWFESQNHHDPELATRKHGLDSALHDEEEIDQDSLSEAVDTRYLEDDPPKNALDCSEVIIITVVAIAVMTSIWLR